MLWTFVEYTLFVYPSAPFAAECMFLQNLTEYTYTLVLPQTLPPLPGAEPEFPACSVVGGLCACQKTA